MNEIFEHFKAHYEPFKKGRDISANQRAPYKKERSFEPRVHKLDLPAHNLDLGM